MEGNAPASQSQGSDGAPDAHAPSSWFSRVARAPIKLIRWLSPSVDYERQLKSLRSNEETVRARLRRRSSQWRLLSRLILLYSVAIEVMLLAVAAYVLQVGDITWQSRVVRMVPAILLPLVSFGLYSGCARFHRFGDERDKKLLDRLTSERRQKIEEMKEKSDYYRMQQLIQQYDTDPQAQKAAASVLISKIGAEAGLPPSVSEAPPLPDDGRGDGGGGLRRRRGPADSCSPGGAGGGLVREPSGPVDRLAHRRTGSELGWWGRLAAVLVGEDPSQSYALVCEKCHAHNGLAAKADYQFITYFCPHCGHLNGAQHLEAVQEAATPAAGAGPTPALSETEEETPPLTAKLREDTAASTGG